MPALLLALALLLPTVAIAARADPVLVRRAAARQMSTAPTVKDIVFAGNNTFEEELLFPYMQTRESGLFRKSYYDRRAFLQDLANLQRFYVSQGFLEADVEMDDISLSADSTRVEILIGVYEGDRWMVDGVTFEGESVIPENELRSLVLLDEGSPFLVNFVERDRRVVSEEYARRSYLDARVLQDVTRDDESRLVTIDYSIVEREQASIASIDVVGDEKTRQFVVERELTFHPGELFDFEKIGESQANVYRTGLFNSVWIEPSPADTGKPEKRVVVRVGERASGELDLSVNYAGINLSEGFQGLDFLELGTEFRNRNVQGNATSMALGGRYSGIAREARASVGDPWFLGMHVAAEFAAHYDWKDEESFLSEVSGGSFVLSKKLGLNVTVETGYEYDHNYVESDDGKETTETSDLFFGADIRLEERRAEREPRHVPRGAGGPGQFASRRYERLHAGRCGLARLRQAIDGQGRRAPAEGRMDRARRRRQRGPRDRAVPRRQGGSGPGASARGAGAGRRRRCGDGRARTRPGAG